MENKQEQPPQALIDWLDEIREKGILPSSGEVPHPYYFLTGYRADGTHKNFRSMDAYGAEEDAALLWNTGNWTHIDINGETRYTRADADPALTAYWDGLAEKG